ncbi:MAG: hypothetical protein IT379_27040 [Deltaproteobacteria bacterium]|nr:hypothetical protein [Deltaproteobacteria bacterium]
MKSTPADRDRTLRGCAVASLVAVATVACGGGRVELSRAPSGAAAAASEPSRPPHRIAYEAELSRSIEHIDVRACFASEPPSRLRPGREAARPLLVGATRREGDRWEPLGTDAIGIVLADTDEGDCVGYRIDLGAVRGRGGAPLVARVGADVFTTFGAWLWGPDDDAPVEATLRVVLPDGYRTVFPFERRGDVFVLPDSTFRFVGFGAFGRFEADRVPVPGGALDVAWLDPGVPMREGRDALRGWLARAARATASLYGRFPVERAAVTVVPIPGVGREGFGMVGRGGGASVFLLVDTASTIADLDGNWVTVHEMSHLAAPYVRRSDAWLGEGLATYYQEILRARGGLQTPLEAWRNLEDGFRRGARSGSGRTLEAESAAVFRTFEFVRVYWAGAAIAFLVDVELRRTSGGRMSLDTAMAGLRACCSEARQWTAHELIAAMDRATGGRVVSRTARRWLRSAEFPDVSGALRAVGVRSDGEGVALEPNALRDAIVSAPPGM